MCVLVYLPSVNNAKLISVTLERKRACEYVLLSFVLCVGLQPLGCFSHVGGSGRGGAVPESSTVWLQMQRKRWLGHAVDEHVVGCWGQMAAECVVGVIVVCMQ